MLQHNSSTIQQLLCESTTYRAGGAAKAEVEEGRRRTGMSYPEAKSLSKDPSKLEYARAVSYIFDNPNWLMNGVWSLLCQLVAQVIPIVPQMVMTGYQFDVFDGLLASGGTRYPDFNINRLSDYLVRGVWPILGALIVVLAWTPILLLGVGLGIAAIAGLGALGGKDAGPGLAFVGIFFLVIAVLVLVALLLLLITPVAIRAGIAQDFGATFDFAWITDFLTKMWVDVILASLFMIFVAAAITVLTCGVGGLIVGPLMPFVSSHFWYQFYIQYLSRGGRPVPAKVAAYAPPR
jgi:uncharacterized protein DUF4013